MSPIPASNADLRIGTNYQSDGDVAVRGDFSVGGVVAGLSGEVFTKEITFAETTSGTSYSGTMVLPAGSRILDIGVDGQALWSATTAASIVVGDAASATGFFTATNLVATDLLAGEINNIEHPGGKAGAYIASEQRVLYQASARTIVATVTKGGAGTSGRTRVYVAYTTNTPVAGA